MPYLSLPAWQSKAKAVVLLSVLSLAACSDPPAQGPGGMKVPVSVVTVQPQPAQVTVDLPGRISALQDAQVRARVSGIVDAINFEQGSNVKAGQLLFTIDPAPYQAVRDQAAAQLQRAQADARAAQLLADRYSRLVKERAVSQQEYDNATSAAAQARAAVASAKAALQAAEIDLGYTKVTSPIDGRIGKAYVTEGALVSAAQATLLADVQAFDRVYVDITRSTTQLAQLRKAIADGVLKQSADGSAQVRVILEDGAEHTQAGKLLFSGVSVDPSTGQVNLRAEVDNPDQTLLPGMYVRARIDQGVDEQALLVPQQAVRRDANGDSSLMVVKDETVSAVPVTVGPVLKGQYLITSGVQAGDVVIVEGFQKIRPGAPVAAMPWKPAGQGDPAASGTGGGNTSTSPQPAGTPSRGQSAD
ncbi:MAG: efflux RND transporter periplasmic adaptor subunit [Alcaligenaceae bacterium]|nr:efflux RND transporter periplasmic adaptor subunit [Alcaligenaceae bacterium]